MGGSLSFDQEHDRTQDKNLRFYRNEIKSNKFIGNTIEEMLRWKGKYSKLESKHDYIQWLFPIPGSRGMNYSAQPLFEEEAKAIRDDDLASARVLAAYRMMLDFYGMFLENEENGIVCRKRNYQEQYNNLSRYTHNFRRITRILISLGELGYERFQVPWVTFLMEEVIVYKLLPNLNGGCMTHWIDAIKDKKERCQMYKNYENLKEGRPPSSAYCGSDKPEIDTIDSNYEPAKVDNHAQTQVHGAECYPYGSSAGESPENVIDDNKGIDMNTPKSSNISKEPINNETVGQSGHNHSATSKSTKEFEMSEMPTASSTTKVNYDHSVSLAKPGKHESDTSCKDEVNKSDISTVNDHDVTSMKADDHATDSSSADGMESPKTIPIQVSSLVNGEASASLESNIDSDNTTVAGYNASYVHSQDSYAISDPPFQNMLIQRI